MLAEATQYVGGEEYVSCSSVLPLLAFLTRQLRVQDDDPGYIARFKAATLDDLTRRVEGMNSLPTLQMATALDPRYKKLKCLPKDKREAVWTVLCNTFQGFCNKDEQVAQTTGQEEGNTDVATEPEMKKPKLTLSFTDSETSDDEGNAEDHNGLADFTRYRAEDQIPETESSDVVEDE